MRQIVSSFLVLLLLIQSLVTPFIVSPVYALNDTTTTWTFNTANAGNYTYDTSLVTVDNSGARPVTGVNKITNPAFASDNSSWSTAAVAPSGWAEVPGNSTYSTTNFLVMKYEAKCAATSDTTTGLTTPDTGYNTYANNTTACTSANSRQVVSVASGYPIANIAQTTSATYCSGVTLNGNAAHLITNNEWMTSARNAEVQAGNWTTGTVGSGALFSGHNDNSPALALAASTDDTLGYTGTGNSSGSSPGQKRTHTLSNGTVLWDFPGNVWEWTNDTIQRKDQPLAWNGTTDDATGFNWSDYASGSLARYIKEYKVGSSLQQVDAGPSVTTYNANQGIGRIYHYSDPADVNTTSYGFLRGGNWNIGSYAGLFTLNLNNTPSAAYDSLGFRCASDPVAISQSFSSSSGRAAAGGNTVTIGSVSDGKIYQSVNVGDTSTYDFSAYVYDNTSGNVGGTVSSSIAQLYYNGAVISTTYTDAGSGWWKLSGTLTGANASREYGVQVKAGKTVKVDDFTLSKSGTYSVHTTSAYSNTNVQSWDSFSATDTASGNASVVYQLCTDDGSTCQSGSAWKYWDGDSWETASNTTTHVNTEAQLTQTAMQALPTTSTKLSVKALLGFGGTDTPELDTITVGLTTDTASPTISLTALSPDPTTDTTPTLSGTATEDIDTVSSVEFQMDGTSGSWTACTATDGTFDEISESFTCTVSSALSDGSHTMYVRATDSNGNTTASGSVASDSFTVDITTPLSFDLESPGNNSYINSDRPTFKWKGTSDSTAGLSKYVLTVDNGESGDFTIDDIPVNRTTDYETNRYVIHYENFNDSDTTNNYISVTTKSSSDWGTDHNDGKLKEGRRNWTIRVRDNAGNERTEGRTVFVDKKGPSLNLTQINETAFSSTSFSTTDKTPTIFGKITDSLSGDSSSTSEQVKQDNKVVSGPKSVEVKLEKRDSEGIYTLDTITNVNLNETYWTSDGTKITDNTQQKSDKYSTFEFTPSAALPLGTYRLILTGKDNAGNSGGETTITLVVGTFSQLATPEEQEIVRQEIEKELPDATDEQKEKIQEELEITKPEKDPPKTAAQKSSLTRGVTTFFGNIFKYLGEVAAAGGDAVANGVEQPTQLASKLGEWVYFTGTSFGEIVLDSKPTQIADVKIDEIGKDYAIIRWNTNHYTNNNKINYGETLSYGNHVFAPDRKKEHVVRITGLKPNTKIVFEVMSQGKNYVYDAHHEFTTKKK